ncbi:ATP-binding protein [Mucilaginibacter sp.]|uniref:ATP-binding protein n=1 Tax=Mucilaginibacter sp. TaxID=1882438 RepID=UPI003D0CE90E
MTNTPHLFSDRELLGILSVSPNATAIYTTEQIIIQTANDAMINLWGKDRSVIGRPMLDVIPELSDQPFIEILKNVWNTGITYQAKDTPAKLMVNGKLQQFYFDFIYHAIKNDDGSVYCILHTAVDVTQQNLNRMALEESQEKEQKLFEELAAINEELEASNEELISTNKELQQSGNDLQRLVDQLAVSEAGFRNMIMQAPVAISVLAGPNLIIQTANDNILKVWGKNRSVINKPLHIALPELLGQPFLKILEKVYTGGEPFYGNAAKVFLERDGVLEEAYFNFVYQPLKDTAGITHSIMVVASEVTEQINSRKQIEISEHRLNRMVMTAPIGMTVLRGPELIIDIANKNMLSIWNRKADQVVGKALLRAFPELIGQPFPEMLQEVYTSGLPLAIDEIGVDIASPDGGMTRHYVNFSYDPLFDKEGNVEAILATVINITEQVEAREELHQLQERGRLAVNAARLGTFDMDLTRKNNLEWDERCRHLFGVDHNDPVVYDRDFVMGLHPEDRERVLKVIEASMNKAVSEGEYDVEYRTVGAADKKIRWVRAKGKVFFDDRDTPVRFVGAVLDITAQKQDEQRKNDFIAMVSHELKTPLTSLKAYVQMLMAKARDSEDNFTTTALDKVDKQIKKMTVMINGFLNVSRLEAGQIYLEEKAFDINELIKQTVEEVSLTTQSHNIYYLARGPQMINADHDKIGQVINNFLSNAVKYSAKGKEVEVNYQVLGNTVQVSVKDEGIGINTHDQEKLFDRFYRVNNHDTKTISGFGIGLYLCAEIIRRHDGRIWVESQMGKGSTFYFSLPIH